MADKPTALCLLCLLCCWLFLITTCYPTRQFQHFSSLYSIDNSILPIYQISQPNLHGSLTLEFENLQGTYSLNLKTDFKFLTPPFDENKYMPSWIFNLDMSNVKATTGNIDGNVKFVLNRALMKNVNPYGMGLIGIELSSPFVQREQLNSTEGGQYTLENTFSVSLQNLLSIQRNYIAFQYYVQGVVKEELRNHILISYPRDVSFDLTNYHSKMSLTLSYDTAPVIDPAEISSSTTITAANGNEFIPVPKPYDFLLIAIDINVIKQGVKPLNERTSISFDYSKQTGFENIYSSSKKIFVNVMSIVCAFMESNGGFDIDENSQILEVSSHNDLNTYQSFVLQCSERELRTGYRLYMLAKKYDARTQINCEFGKECDVSGNYILNYEMNNGAQLDQLIFKVDMESSLRGHVTINNEDVRMYSHVSSPTTIQRPLNLQFVFSFEVKISRIDIYRPFLNLEFTNSLQSHIDPSSMRVTILNETTNSFQLFQPDVPKLGEVTWSFNPLHYNTSKIVFGLWNYDKHSATLGEAVFVNYGRMIDYNIENSLNLTIYFDNVQVGSDIQLRPYYVLDNFDGDSSNLIDNSYNVLKSFRMDYYQGLDMLNYDEGRKFKFYPSAQFYDKKGNIIDMKFNEITCAYLIKDATSGNFSTLEFSTEIPIYLLDPIDQEWKYILDCSEDIRATEFLVLLIAKKFEREVKLINFGDAVVFNPAITSRVVTGWSDKDSLQVSINSNSVLNGEFTIYNLDTALYTNYTIPHTTQHPLTILGVFELYHVSSSTSQYFDLGSISVQFIKGFGVSPPS